MVDSATPLPLPPDPDLLARLHAERAEQAGIIARLEEELAVYRSRYEALKSTTDHIYVKDSERRFVDANEPTLKLLGVTSLDDVLGKRDEDIFVQDDQLLQRYIADEVSVLRDGTPVIRQQEKAFHQLDRDYVKFSTTKVPVVRDGRRVELLGLNRDITLLYHDTEQLRLHKKLLDCVLDYRNLRGLWAAIVNMLVTEFRVRSCGLYRYDRDARKLILVAHHQRPRALGDEMALDEPGVAPRLFRDYLNYQAGSGPEPVGYRIIPNYAEDEFRNPRHARLDVLEALCLVLLVYNDQPVGVIYLEDHAGADFEDTARQLHGLSTYIARALILADNQNRQTQEAEALLREVMEPDSGLEAIAQSAKSAMESDVVVLFGYDAATGKLLHPPTIAGELNNPDAVIAEGHVLPDTIPYRLLNGPEEIVFVQDAQEHGNFARREGIASFIGVRLSVDASIIGVMFINYKNSAAFDKFQLLMDRVQFYKDIAARALDNGLEVQRLQATLRAISDSSVIGARASDEHFLQSIVDTLRAELKCDMVSFYRYGETTGRLEIPAIRSGHKHPDQIEAVAPELQDLIHEDLYLYPAHADDRFANNPVVQAQEIQAFAAIPITTLTPEGRRLIKGLLLVNYFSPHRFHEREQNGIRLIAALLGSALANAEDFFHERQMHDISERVRQIASLSADYSRTAHELAESILSALQEIIPCDSATFQLLHEDRDSRDLLAVRGVPLELRATRELLRPLSHDRLVLKIIRSRRPFLISNTESRWAIKTDLWSKLDQTSQIKSWIGIPFSTKQGVIALITLESSKKGYFRPRHERLLQAFADITAVEFANFMGRLQAIADERAVNTIKDTTAITRALIMPEKGEDVLVQLPPVIAEFMHDAGRVEVLIQEGRQLMVKSAFPPDPRRLNQPVPGTSRAAQVALETIESLETGDPGQSDVRPIYLPSRPEAREPERPTSPAEDLNSELLIPLVNGERFLGILHIQHRKPHAFSPVDIDLASALGNLAVVAIKRSEDMTALYDVMARTLSIMIDEHSVPKGKATIIYNRVISILREIDARPARPGLGRLFRPRPGPDIDLQRVRKLLKEIERHAQELYERDLDIYQVGSDTTRILLNTFVAEVVDAFAHNAFWGTNVSFEFIPSAENLLVECHTQALWDVLSILITNAGQANLEMSPAGDRAGDRAGDTVRRRVVVQLVGYSNRAEILISDEGCGMSDDLQAIYGRRCIENSPHGWGIGAVLVRLVVEAYGGSVKIRHTQLNQGTTISVRLPLAIGELMHG